MTCSEFPFVFGDKILGFQVNAADGLDIVERNADGSVKQILIQVKNGGGHLETAAYALQHPDGWETYQDTETNLQYLRLHYPPGVAA